MFYVAAQSVCWHTLFSSYAR